MYELWEGEVVYIGRAQGDECTVRDRLCDHLNNKLFSRVTHFRATASLNPKVHEVRLQESFEKANGRLPKYNQRVG